MSGRTGTDGYKTPEEFDAVLCQLVETIKAREESLERLRLELDKFIDFATSAKSKVAIGMSLQRRLK